MSEREDGIYYEVRGTKHVPCWVVLEAPFTDDEALKALYYGDQDDSSATCIVDEIVEADD